MWSHLRTALRSLAGDTNGGKHIYQESVVGRVFGRVNVTGPSTVTSQRSSCVRAALKTNRDRVAWHPVSDFFSEWFNQEKQRTKQDFEQIWTKLHSRPKVVSGVIAMKEHETLVLKSKMYPVFVLAFRRNCSLYFLVVKFIDREAHFFTLDDYKASPNPDPCLKITYFTDVDNCKNPVPFLAEFDDDFITELDARLITKSLHLFYTDHNSKRDQLLDRFNSASDEFDHLDVVNELECC